MEEVVRENVTWKPTTEVLRSPGLDQTCSSQKLMSTRVAKIIHLDTASGLVALACMILVSLSSRI